MFLSKLTSKILVIQCNVLQVTVAPKAPAAAEMETAVSNCLSTAGLHGDLKQKVQRPVIYSVTVPLASTPALLGGISSICLFLAASLRKYNGHDMISSTNAIPPITEMMTMYTVRQLPYSCKHKHMLVLKRRARTCHPRGEMPCDTLLET